MSALFVPRQQSLSTVSAALSVAPSNSQAPAIQDQHASYDLSVEPQAAESSGHFRATTEPATRNKSSGKATRSRSRTTQQDNANSPPSPGLFDPEDTQLTPKGSLAKKMFSCSGYGNCKMSFSRAEHLARHVRLVSHSLYRLYR